MTFQEITDDHGVSKRVFASNNNATYIITSARARDLCSEFVEKWNRNPSSSWLNSNFRFERIK